MFCLVYGHQWSSESYAQKDTYEGDVRSKRAHPVIYNIFCFFGKNDGNDKSEPASDWDFLYGLAFFAMVYFAIYDFIILFIKRKKYVEKKEPEFGMENIT